MFTLLQFLYTAAVIWCVGMMHLVALVLSTVGVAVDVKIDCAMCRCEDNGSTRLVDCVDVGLSAVPSSLSGFMSHLDLSMNELLEVPAHAFSGLHGLQELWLAGNSLTHISKDAFAGLIDLKVLMLQNNRLKKVPSEALKNLRNLQTLRLDANFIAHLPACSFKGLMSLRHLRLDDNILEEVPVALAGLSRLEALTLALNNISHIPDRVFASLSHLVVLHLHDNRIRALGHKCFDGLHNLETLDLSFNRLKSFPRAIRTLKNLRELNLQNNKITIIPEDAFIGNPSLDTINVWNNPVHNVGQSARQLLPDLRTVAVSATKSNTVCQDVAPTNRLETLAAELLFVFHRCVESVRSDRVDGPGPNRPCLSARPFLQSSIWFIFTLSIIFNFLVLLSIILSLDSERCAVQPLLGTLFCLRLLSGLSGATLDVSALDCFGVSGLQMEAETGCGLMSFLFTLSSEACVFLIMAVTLEHNSWLRGWSSAHAELTCTACCGLALAISASPVVIRSFSFHPCLDQTYSTTLMVFNTCCYLFTALIQRCQEPRGVPSTTVLLTFLVHSHSVLFSSASILSVLTDVHRCAVLLTVALPACLDPLLYMILSPHFKHELLQHMSQRFKANTAQPCTV